MSYTALYRKYRPATFQELKGQDHIVRTLVNQIEGGKIGHAYLFTGSRGTGKTSAAKIFAKAVNCLTPSQGSPCGKCAVCVAMSDPANLDITEIDAASNNRVDEIRDLREKVKYPPINGRYKVYIIDEVHMLTDSAFNALLKTLEEPPAHAIFILATTEVHKLPATILSRCMRFDFRLISADVLEGILKNIFDDIGKEYEWEAVAAIAAAGEGSVRDALSVADMCVSFSEGKLTAANVLDALGAADTGNLFALAAAIISGDGGGVLEIINAVVNSGKSANLLAKDLASHFRNVMVVKSCKNVKDILHIPAETAEKYRRQGETIDFARCFECAETFAKLDAEMRYSITPRILIETACLKLCLASGTSGGTASGGTAAASPSQKAAAQPAEGSGQKAAPPERNEAAAYESAGSAEAAAVKADTEAGAVQSAEGLTARKLWGTVVRALRERDYNALYAAAADKTAVLFDGGALVLRVADANDFELLDRPVNTGILNGILDELGSGYRFKAQMINAGRRDSAAEDIKRLKELAGEEKVNINIIRKH